MSWCKYLKLAIVIASASIIINSCKEDSNDEPALIKPDAFITDLITTINADSLQKKVKWLEDMGSRFALNPNRKEVAKKIRDRFISYGYSDASLDSFFISKTYMGVTYNMWQYNVIARVEGITFPDSICIMGGHYDSIIKNDPAFSHAPGANDNASGISAILEVARIFKESNFNPQATIEFIAFGAEELGLFGSRDYALKAKNNSKKIRFMLNNDMIAFWPSGLKNMSVNIIDYQNSLNIRKKAEAITMLYSNLLTNNDNTYQAYSDSYPFSLYGFKAVFFTTDADDPNYHTINDLTSNCNFEICEEIAKVNCAMLADYNK